MPVSQIVRIDKFASGTPALDISQMRSQSAQAGNDQINEMPGGHNFPMFTSPGTQLPVFNFQTTQLAEFLAAVPIGGAALADADLYQKIANATGSEARTALAHNRLRIAEGVLYWTTLNLTHNEVSTVDAVVAANYDGTNLPIAALGSQVLPGNLTQAENFGVGPGSLNGTDLPGIQSIVIDSGITLTQEGASSEIWPTFTGIQESIPTATITLDEPVNLNTYSLAGTELNGTTGLRFYGRKFNGSGRVADANLEHIQFSAPFGTIIPTENQGEGNSAMTDTITVHLISNTDSTQPLNVTPNVAIT